MHISCPEVVQLGHRGCETCSLADGTLCEISAHGTPITLDKLRFQSSIRPVFGLQRQLGCIGNGTSQRLVPKRGSDTHRRVWISERLFLDRCESVCLFAVRREQPNQMTCTSKMKIQVYILCLACDFCVKSLDSGAAGIMLVSRASTGASLCVTGLNRCVLVCRRNADHAVRVKLRDLCRRADRHVRWRVPIGPLRTLKPGSETTRLNAEPYSRTLQPNPCPLIPKPYTLQP